MGVLHDRAEDAHRNGIMPASNRSVPAFRMILRRRFAFLAAAALLGGCMAAPPRTTTVADGTRLEIGVLESTDIHSHVTGFDDFTLQTDDSVGIDRMATLVKQARGEFRNALMFDAGDTIQGTPLADYEARVAPVACDTELTVYRAMDAIGYDAGTIGNHEFNYGLPFLSQVTGTPMAAAGTTPPPCAGPHFPQVLANVVDAHDGKPIFPPYVILHRTFSATAPDGASIEVPLAIGVIGFTPPPIMQWDHVNLAGKVVAEGVVEAAERDVPKLRAAGADLVIAIEHGGIDASPYRPDMENAAWYLAAVPGVDVLLLGHSHVKFPDPGNAKSRFNGLPEVDNRRGFVRGKPAVMGNLWGRSLGVIDLHLVRSGGGWTVDTAATHSEVRDIRDASGHAVEPDAHIDALAAPAVAATGSWVRTPIGATGFTLSTYFAELGDGSALAVINQAQHDYTARYVAANFPQDAGIPVLSAAAPFKAGFAGPGDYTDIEPGPLAIRDAADLYIYPNTLAAVKIDGAELKAWLEHSALRFNRIDPADAAPQALINRRFPAYDFDVIGSGLTYVVDPTQPVGQRIDDLRFRGKPVAPDAPFIVATNNYRASGGGGFPGLDGSRTLFAAPDMNREIVIAWLKAHPRLRKADIGPTRNWRFARIATKGPVVFTSAAGKLGVARAAGLDGVRLLHDNGDGTADYAVDFNR